MTLKVAHVLNSPGNGGVPRVVRALVRHADLDRIAPHVFYLKPGTGPDLLADLDFQRRVARSASKAAAMTELVAWLDAHRIDILHTHSFRPNLYGRMAGAVLRPAGLKIVAHYHNDYSDKWTGDALVVERRLAAVTDAGLAVSDFVASHVADRTGLTAEVVENGVDLDRVAGGCRATGRAALDVPQDAPAIGLVGRICRQKGVDTFVDAAIRLGGKEPQIRFIIVGEAEDPELVRALKLQIDIAGMAGRIIFAGHKDDIADILAAIDVLAAPSRWEGFGLALVEAMAAGVPIVSSDAGGIPSVVGKAAIMVPPEDPDVLARALSVLLADPARRAAMIDAGRDRAERFDWRRSAAKVGALYDRLAAQR